MKRGNQTSSRKRIFQDMNKLPENFVAELPHALQQLDAQANDRQVNVHDDLQLGKRVSTRRTFFHNLKDKEASSVSKTLGDEDGDDDHNLQLGKRASSRRTFFHNLKDKQASSVSKTLGDEDGDNNHNLQLGKRVSSRRTFFHNLKDKEASISKTLGDENGDDDHSIEVGRRISSRNIHLHKLQNDNLSSFGQAYYQKSRQGIIVEYKDFGDNNFQCAYCNAYYWQDEMNTRGVYTGCCKGGQVKLQSSKPTPQFLEYLLNSNSGAKGFGESVFCGL